jgi:NADPH:quinone reductase-like Zn-dependent oxidoreductase
MRAIILKETGSAAKLVTVNLPIPEAADNEVLIKTKAFSINPVDIKTRLGRGLATLLKDYDPVILGWDVSGTVIKTGKSVSLFRKGDEVFGMVNFPGHGKAYAEYVTSPEMHLAVKPASVSFEDAAAASLAALTAWQILREKLNVNSGKRILIHAAAGGVGHYAIQMAKYLGAYVAATASERNRQFVLSLGADEHIDYQNILFDQALSDFDYVLDSIGGSYIDRSLKVLKPGGTIISIPSGASESVKEKAALAGMTGDTFRVHSDGNNMNEIAGLLKAGVLRSHVSQVFGFDHIQQAHQAVESGRTRGKVVITIS